MTCVLAIGRSTGELIALAGGTLTKLAAANAELSLAVVPLTTEPSAEATGSGVASSLHAQWLGSVVVEGDEDGRRYSRPGDGRHSTRAARHDPRDGPRGGRVDAAHGTRVQRGLLLDDPELLSPTGLDPASVRAPIVSLDRP